MCPHETLRQLVFSHQRSTFQANVFCKRWSPLFRNNSRPHSSMTHSGFSSHEEQHATLNLNQQYFLENYMQPKAAPETVHAVGLTTGINPIFLMYHGRRGLILRLAGRTTRLEVHIEEAHLSLWTCATLENVFWMTSGLELRHEGGVIWVGSLLMAPNTIAGS